MPLQPKAVLFDYGNVLSMPQNRAEVDDMAAIFAVPVPQFEQAYWKGRLAFDRADLTPEDYWADISQALSRSLSSDQRERVIELDNLSWVVPNPVMAAWAAQLRAAGVRTGLLSNMPITLRRHLRRDCRWLPEFDHSCYSCEVREVKPAPEIYRLSLSGLGAQPGEVLFLDDREENIEAARSLGIHTIRFSTAEQAQCEIQQHYQLPVPIPLQAGSGERASRSQSSS